MKVTPEMIGDADGAFKALNDMLPPHWWSMYQGCLKEGFTDEQAMRLLLKHIEKPCKKKD